MTLNNKKRIKRMEHCSILFIQIPIDIAPIVFEQVKKAAFAAFLK